MARLSKRMEAVAALVAAGGVLADIGTDHAYVPIVLVERGRIRRAIAMDIGEGPLSRARKNIVASGLEDRIQTRLSDGLSGLRPGEADSVLIAGMGGALTIRILSDGEAVREQAKELVLQPQSDVPEVRRFLREQGWRIDAEDMVCEDGKYYPMMRAVHGKEKGADDELERLGERYGRLLIEGKNPVLRDYLERERRKYEQILAQLAGQESGQRKQRTRELRELLDDNRKAYSRMGEL